MSVMPSRPYLRALTRWIEEQGGEPFILDRIAAGESVGKIAKSIQLPGRDKPISRAMLYYWRNAGGDERKKGWELAMKESAEALAEEAGEVLDNLSEEFDPTSAQVSLARSRSEYKRWLASKRDADTFGDRKSDVNVNVLSLGDVHLDALRKLGSRDALPLPEAEALPLLESSDAGEDS
jgi:hypothetical protein